jgi:hypothetical protein
MATRTLCLLAVLTGAAAAHADDPLLDVQHTVLARQALQDDPLLRPHNLGVRVRDRVAVLWGPSPSKELGERAAAVLRKLPQLREVRNELFLDPWSDPAAPLPPARPPAQQPPQQQPPPQQPPPPAVFAGQTRPRPDSGKPPLEWIPVKQSPPKAADPPVQLEKPSLQKEAPKPPSPPAPVQDITEAVRRLQRGDERYRRVTFAVEGHAVYLSGVAYRWQDIHELSRAVSAVPGVERVILRGLRAER